MKMSEKLLKKAIMIIKSSKMAVRLYVLTAICAIILP